MHSLRVSVPLLVLPLLAVVAACEARENEHELSIDIERSPATVYTFVREPDKLRGWLQWRELALEDAEHLERGVRFHVVTSNGDDLVEMDGEVTAAETERLLSLHLRSSDENTPFTEDVTFLLEELAADRTRFTMQLNADYGAGSWLIKPLVHGTVEARLHEDLELLKEACEREPDGG